MNADKSANGKQKQDINRGNNMLVINNNGIKCLKPKAFRSLVIKIVYKFHLPFWKLFLANSVNVSRA